MSNGGKGHGRDGRIGQHFPQRKPWHSRGHSGNPFRNTLQEGCIMFRIMLAVLMLLAGCASPDVEDIGTALLRVGAGVVQVVRLVP